MKGFILGTLFGIALMIGGFQFSVNTDGNFKEWAEVLVQHGGEEIISTKNEVKLDQSSEVLQDLLEPIRPEVDYFIVFNTDTIKTANSFKPKKVDVEVIHGDTIIISRLKHIPSKEKGSETTVVVDFVASR